MANKRLNAVISIGGALNASLGNAFNSVKGKVGEVGSALRRLETEQRTLTNAIRVFGMEGKNVDGLRTRYASLTSQIDKLRASQERLNNIQRAQQNNLSQRGELRGQMFEAVGVGAAVAAPIVQAAQFEKSMLGVAKQVNGARDDAGNLTKVYYEMGSAIQEMGREIPIATNQLAEMVAAGARMGVEKDELLGFTRNAAMMASAFELPAAQLAEDMGKIAGLYKIPIGNINQLADSINYLDDNAISKGGDIIDFLSRVGGSASTVKISGVQMAALGSTLLTLGERTETAGTAVNAMFSKFAAADKGTKKFKAAMSEIGLNPKAVQAGMAKNAEGTLLHILEQIKKLPEQKRAGVLAELVGLEHQDTLGKLVGNIEEYRKQIGLANSQKAKGSMSREFAATLATTSAQFEIMKNKVTEISVNIGSALLPGVNSFFRAITPVTTAVAEFARAHPVLTRSVVGTAVALVSLRLATLASRYAFTFLRGGVLQVVGALATVRAQMTLTAIANRATAASTLVARSGFLGMAVAARAATAAMITNPIGAAVAAIAAGGFLIYKYWDGVKAFFSGFGAGLVAGLQPAVEVFRAWVATMAPIQPLIDGVGSAVKTAWEWFTKLLEPVTSSKEQLAGATTAGEKFGRIVGGAINLALSPLQALIKGMTWVSNNAGSILNGVGSAFSKARSLLPEWAGGTPAEQSAPVGASAPSLPAVPAIAASKGGGTVNDNSQTKIYVTQQPGQSASGLADEVMRKIEEKKATRNRGAMHDGATQ